MSAPTTKTSRTVNPPPPGAVGAVFRADVTDPSNYPPRTGISMPVAEKRGIVGIAGIDTRALTAPHPRKGHAQRRHRACAGRQVRRYRRPESPRACLARPVGLDLAKVVTAAPEVWTEDALGLERGLWRARVTPHARRRHRLRRQAQHPAPAAGLGRKVTVVPATDLAEGRSSHKPDGIFLSNGPGDPAATGKYAVPTIKALMETGKPMFGICLGHQMLALALGGKTDQDAPGPPRRQPSGQGPHHRQGRDHLDEPRLRGRHREPAERREETHVSLFDGSNCGIAVEGKPIFSVQYHPEASPGPQDSHYLFIQVQQFRSVDWHGMRCRQK
jgi:carbamoyl-phosphate synthase small subunit